jgi:putative membrane protein
MLKRISTLAAVVFMLAGCSESMQQLGGMANPSLSDRDNDYFKTMALTNMTEISAGRLALDNSQNSAVKTFAQRMIDDHTQAEQELSDLAGSQQVSLPTRLDDSHQKMIDQLKEKTGADFDKAYINDQVAGHKEAIATDRDEASNGTNPKERAYANGLMSTLDTHLSLAEKLQSDSGM